MVPRGLLAETEKLAEFWGVDKGRVGGRECDEDF